MPPLALEKTPPLEVRCSVIDLWLAPGSSPLLEVRAKRGDVLRRGTSLTSPELVRRKPTDMSTFGTGDAGILLVDLNGLDLARVLACVQHVSK